MKTQILLPELLIFCIFFVCACAPFAELVGSEGLTTEETIIPDQPSSAEHTENSPANKEYWPTEEWRAAGPEEVGMDVRLIDQMLVAIDESGIDLHSVLVVHDGYIVAERYYAPFNQEDLHESYSITKSVISALVGIAIEQGILEGIDQKVLDFFPGNEFENNSVEKQSITLEHLLTMSSGLEEDWNAMVSSPDWVQTTLDQPMLFTPGEQFDYNNGNAHVLSAILQASTEQDLIEYARQQLFEPLGIEDLRWQTDLNDIPKGGWGLSLKPRDLAKLGYLYLKEGAWDGQQIVPAAWVKASTQPYIQVPEPLEPWDLHMGYLWWLHDYGPYAAHGTKGQFIYVVEEHDLVVVFTGNLPDADFVKPQILIRDYIIPAVAGSGGW